MSKAAILCLDDEPVGVAIRAALLRHAGYDVFPATSAQVALQILAEQQIDVVVSDYLLEDTTGTQVAASMKQIKPDVPVVILSGLIEEPEGMELVELFLSKAEPPQVFLANISKLLADRKQAVCAVVKDRGIA